ncbi:MAG: fatty acid desaturase [Betaproteobacteria bacterium]
MAPPSHGTTDRRGTLRDRIRQRQPRELPLSAYVSGWLQALIQLTVFLGSLWLLQGETRAAWVVLYACAFGWSWFTLLMVGHDAMHRAFAPWQWVNETVAFFTLDCLLFSRAAWFQGHHVIHHARPHSEEDMMYLRGNSVPVDMWNLLRMVLDYLAADFIRLVRRPVWHEWLGMAIRIGVFVALMPFALVPAVLFLLFFGNYLGLLSHSLPVNGRSEDPVIRQLRTTWDLFPDSFLASLVTGGLNAHVTHHVYPTLPRGAQKWGSRVLREEVGGEYRCIQSLAGIRTLFRLRYCSTAEIATIETIEAGIVALFVAPDRVAERVDVTHANPQTTRHRPRVVEGWARNPINAHAKRGLQRLRSAFVPARDSGAHPAPQSASSPSSDKRLGDRRVRQTSLTFPDRRTGERRGGGLRAVA